jgi:hypothetical protein
MPYIDKPPRQTLNIVFETKILFPRVTNPSAGDGQFKVDLLADVLDSGVAAISVR